MYIIKKFLLSNPFTALLVCTLESKDDLAGHLCFLIHTFVFPSFVESCSTKSNYYCLVYHYYIFVHVEHARVWEESILRTPTHKLSIVHLWTLTVWLTLNTLHPWTCAHSVECSYPKHTPLHHLQRERKHQKWEAKQNKKNHYNYNITTIIKLGEAAKK